MGGFALLATRSAVTNNTNGKTLSKGLWDCRVKNFLPLFSRDRKRTFYANQNTTIFVAGRRMLVCLQQPSSSSMLVMQSRCSSAGRSSAFFCRSHASLSRLRMLKRMLERMFRRMPKRTFRRMCKRRLRSTGTNRTGRDA